MYIYPIILSFFAVCFDFFFSSITFFHVYTGLLLIIVYLVKNENKKSLIFALTYGFLLDCVSHLAPFGIMIIYHAAVWVFLVWALRVFSYTKSNIKKIISVFVISVIYSFLSGVIHYSSINVFTNETVRFNSLISYKHILMSSLATSIIVIIIILIFSWASSLLGKWFFIK